MKTVRRFLTQIRNLFTDNSEEPSDYIDFDRLEEVLQYSIRDRNIFRQALSHRSYLHVNNTGQNSSNERLEFLGDSVLNLVVGEYLYRREPAAQEGDLTKTRSRFVNRKALSVFAREIRIEDFILMSPSTTQLSLRGIDTIVSNAFEAIAGALYLDGGYGQAKKFIERCLVSAIDSGAITLNDENYKSQLLELSQGDGSGVPRYTTVSESGPDHDRTFTVQVFIGKDLRGTGTGKNKKDAEQSAAADALRGFGSRGNET